MPLAHTATGSVNRSLFALRTHSTLICSTRQRSHHTLSSLRPCNIASNALEVSRTPGKQSQQTPFSFRPRQILYHVIPVTTSCTCTSQYPPLIHTRFVFVSLHPRSQVIRVSTADAPPRVLLHPQATFAHTSGLIGFVIDGVVNKGERQRILSDCCDISHLALMICRGTMLLQTCSWFAFGAYCRCIASLRSALRYNDCHKIIACYRV